MSSQGTVAQQTAAQIEASQDAAESAEMPREEEAPPAATICGLKYITALKLFLVVLIITGIVLGLTVGDLDSRLVDLLEWLEDNRIEGIVIYIALYASLTGACQSLSCVCWCSAHEVTSSSCQDACSLTTAVAVTLSTNPRTCQHKISGNFCNKGVL